MTKIPHIHRELIKAWADGESGKLKSVEKIG